MRASLVPQRQLIQIRAQRLAVVRRFIHLLPGAEGPPHQAVDAEHLLLEEHAVVQIPACVEFLIECFVEALHVDSEILQQTLCDAVPMVRRTIDGLGAAVTEQSLPVDHELVAFGMPAEIVVGIQQQDAGIGAALPVEVRGRQPADARTDHGQIVMLRERGLRDIEACTVPQSMRRLE